MPVMPRAHAAPASILLAGLLVACCGTTPPALRPLDPAGPETQRGIVRDSFGGADLRAVSGDAPGFRDGLRGSVSAAWWGFDEQDATAALQASLDSGARVIVVPSMGRAWVTGPLSIRSHTTLVLEEGVQIVSKQGAFQKNDSSLFTLRDVEDVTIYGYGARAAMRKVDYRKAPYEQSEWRHAIEMYGCSRVSIFGLTVESSGGDGVYLGRGRQTYTSDVLLRDLVLRDHYRQGISVISAQDVRFENLSISFTEGTPPSAGIDFEPNHADERIVRCVMTGCVIYSNRGPGMLAALQKLDAGSQDIDITVEDCTITGSPLSLVVGGSASVGGRITFVRSRLHGLQLVRPGTRAKISGN